MCDFFIRSYSLYCVFVREGRMDRELYAKYPTAIYNEFVGYETSGRCFFNQVAESVSLVLESCFQELGQLLATFRATRILMKYRVEDGVC